MTFNRSTPDPDRLVIRNQIELVAALPYLMGFEPKDSVVLVMLRESNSPMMQARIDFPHAEEDYGAVASSVLHACQRGQAEGGTRALLVIYPQAANGRIYTWTKLASALGAILFDVCGVPVTSIGAVIDSKYFDHDDPNLQGVPISDYSDRIASHFIGMGETFSADIGELTEEIDGPDTPMSELVWDVLRERRFQYPDSFETAKGRRAIENEIFRYLSADPFPAGASGPQRADLKPTPEVLAMWILALHDSRVREPILRRIATYTGAKGDAPVSRAGAAEPIAASLILSRMVWVARNAPVELGSAPAATASAIAWHMGNGVMARLAAERALDCDPANVLAGLVLQGCMAGMHPRFWHEQLTALSLKSLREGGKGRNRPQWRTGAAGLAGAGGLETDPYAGKWSA